MKNQLLYLYGTISWLSRAADEVKVILDVANENRNGTIKVQHIPITFWGHYAVKTQDLHRGDNVSIASMIQSYDNGRELSVHLYGVSVRPYFEKPSSNGVQSLK